jgi:hypothetical protein
MAAEVGDALIIPPPRIVPVRVDPPGLAVLPLPVLPLPLDPADENLPVPKRVCDGEVLALSPPLTPPAEDKEEVLPSVEALSLSFPLPPLDDEAEEEDVPPPPPPPLLPNPSKDFKKSSFIFLNSTSKSSAVLAPLPLAPAPVVVCGEMTNISSAPALVGGNAEPRPRGDGGTAPALPSPELVRCLSLSLCSLSAADLPAVTGASLANGDELSGLDPL